MLIGVRAGWGTEALGEVRLGGMSFQFGADRLTCVLVELPALIGVGGRDGDPARPPTRGRVLAH